ncbi:MAG: hypothetical protein RLZZ383_1824, partial [Pseudomonadota bacterium]
THPTSNAGLDTPSPKGRQRSLLAPGLAVGVLSILFALSFTLNGGDTLLTPLPSAWVGPPVVAAIALALFLAMAVASAMPGGLLRRLVVIGVMAATLYLSGETARGVYALVAFTGDVERDTLELMVTGASSGSVYAIDQASPGRVLTLPASEAVARVPPHGHCVTVATETAASGAVRIAKDGWVVTPDAVGPCGRMQRAPSSRPRP